MTERPDPPYVPAAREPFCIHSNNTQPMSACIECKDHPHLQAWKDYWRDHPRQPRPI